MNNYYGYNIIKIMVLNFGLIMGIYMYNALSTYDMFINTQSLLNQNELQQ